MDKGRRNDTKKGKAAAAHPRGQRSVTNRIRRRTFLDHLAATSNVKLASAAAGVGASYFYQLRRTDAVFAAGWEAAVQAGYERLEQALLARALHAAEQFDPGAVALELVDAAAGPAGDAADTGDDADAPDEAEADAAGADGAATAGTVGVEPAGASRALRLKGVARVDVQTALMLLNRRAGRQRGGRERNVRRRPSAAEVETLLNAKLDVLARRVTPLGGDNG